MTGMPPAVTLRDAQDELRRLTEQLERSDAYFRSLIENVTDIVTIIEADGKIRYISPSVKSVLGYAPEERVGRDAFDLLHPDDHLRLRQLVAEAVVGRRTASLVSYRYRHANGSWRQLEASAINLLGESAVNGIVVVSRDITERVEIENRYQALFENMVEGFAHCRMVYRDGKPSDWIFLEANRSFTRLIGVADVVGRTVSDLIPGILEQNPELFEIYGRVTATGEPAYFETYLHGLRMWCAVSAYSTGPSQFAAMFEDISERKATEARLRVSEAEFHSLIDQAPLGIYRATPDGRLLMVNRALVRLLGCESADAVLRLNVARDVYADPAERERLITRAGANRETVIAEVVWRRQDGGLISVRLHMHAVRDADGGVQYFDTLAEDVTEQKDLERQFHQAQKLEAVGRLAGGVAHDFNNLLTTILGYSELVREALPPNDPTRADVDDIFAAAQRATALTRQLLAFSRKSVFQPRVVDVNESVRGLEKMLRRLIGEDLVLDVALAAAPATVRADPGQIEQVILNLVVNARDAMPAGGRLTIRVANVPAAEGIVADSVALPPGPYVKLSVTDTGVGMPPEILRHIFEPFFTTKEQGKGTGLGLSTVFGIVTQSGGRVWPSSEPGRGSTFTVCLPFVDDVEEEQPAMCEPTRAAGGRERILVAEDDNAVQVIIARALSSKGYDVLLAHDGPDALGLLRANDRPVDLLITDFVMPGGMNGLDLAKTVSTVRTRMPTLFISGYSENPDFSDALASGVHFLAKPFTADALTRKVREILSSARPTSSSIADPGRPSS